MRLTPELATKTLAAIRVLNGTAGLLAPQYLLRRLGSDPRIDRSGMYPFRMFGIRTILIGADLFILRGEELRRAQRLALVIHASDTASATVAGVRGDLPRKPAVIATLVSAINTALAFTAIGGFTRADAERRTSRTRRSGLPILLSRR